MPSFSLLLTLAVIALHTTFTSARPVYNSGNAYSGKGGHASGGNVTFSDKKENFLSSLGLGLLDHALVKINSGNAGHGGKADSGMALGGGGILGPKLGRWARGSNSGNAYSQDGGVADGGSVKGADDALININSNNAGYGGAASSGAAVGGGGGGGKDDHGGEQDGDREGNHWDDDDHQDDDHRDDDYEDEYEDEDYEKYLDRKRHEHHRNDDDCDC